jgi:glycerol kinase
MVGTIDTWVTWCLTGGHSFVTDVTNASRTFLLNLHTLEWDDKLLGVFGIPRRCLANVKSSAEIYGRLTSDYGIFEGCPISGVLGDQQASLVGNRCIEQGTAKITYGTGCFLLYHTGEQPTFHTNGLITTVAYQMGKKARPCYAVEGSVATCGFAVQWLNDVLGKHDKVWDLAATVKNSGGVYFVPAFSGLLCPYWRPDARGCFLGLTGYTTRGHMARSVIEGVAFQTMDVLQCVDMPLTMVRVDGGLARSDLLLQFQADVLGIEVRRSANLEATSRGAAIAAAYGVGLVGAGIIHNDDECMIFQPTMEMAERERRQKMWKKALARSMDWIEPDEEKEEERETGEDA